MLMPRSAALVALAIALFADVASSASLFQSGPDGIDLSQYLVGSSKLENLKEQKDKDDKAEAPPKPHPFFADQLVFDKDKIHEPHEPHNPHGPSFPTFAPHKEHPKPEPFDFSSHKPHQPHEEPAQPGYVWIHSPALGKIQVPAALVLAGSKPHADPHQPHKPHFPHDPHVPHDPHKEEHEEEKAVVEYENAVGSFCRFSPNLQALNEAQCEAQDGCLWKKGHDQVPDTCLCKRDYHDCISYEATKGKCFWWGSDSKYGTCVSSAEKFYRILRELLEARGKKDFAIRIAYKSAPARAILPYGIGGPGVYGFGSNYAKGLPYGPGPYTGQGNYLYGNIAGSHYGGSRQGPYGAGGPYSEGGAGYQEEGYGSEREGHYEGGSSGYDSASQGGYGGGSDYEGGHGYGEGHGYGSGHGYGTGHGYGAGHGYSGGSYGYGNPGYGYFNNGGHYGGGHHGYGSSYGHGSSYGYYQPPYGHSYGYQSYGHGPGYYPRPHYGNRYGPGYGPVRSSGWRGEHSYGYDDEPRYEEGGYEEQGASDYSNDQGYETSDSYDSSSSTSEYREDSSSGHDDYGQPKQQQQHRGYPPHRRQQPHYPRPQYGSYFSYGPRYNHGFGFKWGYQYPRSYRRQPITPAYAPPEPQQQAYGEQEQRETESTPDLTGPTYEASGTSQSGSGSGARPFFPVSDVQGQGYGYIPGGKGPYDSRGGYLAPVRNGVYSPLYSYGPHYSGHKQHYGYSKSW